MRDVGWHACMRETWDDMHARDVGRHACARRGTTCVCETWDKDVGRHTYAKHGRHVRHGRADMARHAREVGMTGMYQWRLRLEG